MHDRQVEGRCIVWWSRCVVFARARTLKPLETRAIVRGTTIQVHRLSGSSILVDEGSVQLASISLALRLRWKVEHLCSDQSICNCTVTKRCFSSPERESPQRWLRSVVESVFRRNGRRLRHVAQLATEKGCFLCLLQRKCSRDELRCFVDRVLRTRGTGVVWMRLQLCRLRKGALASFFD